MARSKDGLQGCVEKLQASSAPTTPAAPSGLTPWSDARVREILGAAGDPQAMAAARRGLIFAMDATSSREPSWAAALEVQAAMFSVVTKGLRVQLVYFRGNKEFEASGWTGNGAELANEMRGVTCRMGVTQIGRVLAHAYTAAEDGKVAALVYVGDHMEESPSELAMLARKLAARGVRALMFQEGSEGTAQACFQEIARLTKGAYCRLNERSASELRDVLSAAAAYAAKGTAGLAELAKQQPAARLLLTQLK